MWHALVLGTLPVQYLPDYLYLSRSRFQIPVVVAARRIIASNSCGRGPFEEETLQVKKEHPTGNFEQHERGVQAPSITARSSLLDTHKVPASRRPVTCLGGSRALITQGSKVPGHCYMYYLAA